MTALPSSAEIRVQLGQPISRPDSSSSWRSPQCPATRKGLSSWSQQSAPTWFDAPCPAPSFPATTANRSDPAPSGCGAGRSSVGFSRARKACTCAGLAPSSGRRTRSLMPRRRNKRGQRLDRQYGRASLPAASLRPPASLLHCPLQPSRTPQGRTCPERRPARLPLTGGRSGMTLYPNRAIAAGEKVSRRRSEKNPHTHI